MRRQQFLYIALTFLIFVMGQVEVSAQFNPQNPPEPLPGVFFYHVTVASYPHDVAWNSGDGDYNAGQTVWINTSRYNGDFTFTHWTRNGEYYSDQEGFEYTMTDEKADFVAHYIFTPGNPEEPTTRLMSRLHLSSYPVGICSFNMNSGDRHEVGTSYYLEAYGNQGYRFEGWYDGDRLVSTEQSFNYEIPEHDISLVARFVYRPDNPIEPEGGNQEDVDMGDELLGDIDGDDFVDLFDLKYLVNIILEKKGFDPIEAADVNKNTLINIGDVAKLIEILQNQQ